MSQNNFYVTKQYSYSKKIYTIYNNYKLYLSKLNLSVDTLDWRLKHIRGFLKELDKNNIKLEQLTAEDVYDYIMSIQNLSAKTREHRAVCIRLFLNYLKECNLIAFDGNKLFPKIKTIKESVIPSYYTNDEISKIISSVESDNSKLDLCILLIFAKLGFRTRDVKDMKFENINWQTNEIQIIQSKTNWINILPIDEELKYAILDYLKNERPNFESEYIFINENGERYNDHKYYNIVSRCIKKSGLDTSGKRKGPHSLRHSLAKSVMDDNNGINVVSNLLGHTSIKSTKVYLKLNYKELKKISLEVPQW